MKVEAPSSGRGFGGLLAEMELLEDNLVAFRRGVLEVIKELAALRDHLEEPAPGRMVLDVGFQVFRQLVNALREECDLNVGTSRVFFVESEGRDPFCFFFGHLL